jgi:hypothetical protein
MADLSDIFSVPEELKVAEKLFSTVPLCEEDTQKGSSSYLRVPSCLRAGSNYFASLPGIVSEIWEAELGRNGNLSGQEVDKKLKEVEIYCIGIMNKLVEARLVSATWSPEGLLYTRIK